MQLRSRESREALTQLATLRGEKLELANTIARLQAALHEAQEDNGKLRAMCQAAERRSREDMQHEMRVQNQLAAAQGEKRGLAALARQSEGQLRVAREEGAALQARAGAAAAALAKEQEARGQLEVDRKRVDVEVMNHLSERAQALKLHKQEQFENEQLRRQLRSANRRLHELSWMATEVGGVFGSPSGASGDPSAYLGSAETGLDFWR